MSVCLVNGVDQVVVEARFSRAGTSRLDLALGYQYVVVVDDLRRQVNIGLPLLFHLTF